MNPRHYHRLSLDGANHSLQHSDILEEDNEKKESSINHCAITNAVLSTASLVCFEIGDIPPFKAGLEEIGSANVIGFIPNNVIAITTAYGLQSILYNGKYTVEGIKEICRYVQGHTPHAWNHLSKNRKIVAGMTGAALTGYATFSDTISTAYFFKDKGILVSYTLGTLSALANIPTECRESFLYVCEKFGPKEVEAIPAPQEDSSCLQTAGNISLATFKWIIKSICAVEDGLEAYVYVTAMFCIGAPSLQWFILALSTINLFNDLIFNGGNSDNTIERFIEKCRKDIKLDDVIIFIVAAMLGAIAADTKRNLVFALLKDPDAPFPFDIPKSIQFVIGTVGSIPTGINFAGALAPLLKGGSIRLTNYCRANEYQVEAMEKHCVSLSEEEVHEPSKLTLPEPVYEDEKDEKDETVKDDGCVVVLSVDEKPIDDFVLVDKTDDSVVSSPDANRASPTDSISSATTEKSTSSATPLLSDHASSSSDDDFELDGDKNTPSLMNAKTTVSAFTVVEGLWDKVGLWKKRSLQPMPVINSHIASRTATQTGPSALS